MSARKKALPFEPLVPNKETIVAMREARLGKTVAFESIAALMADLDADSGRCGVSPLGGVAEDASGGRR